MTSDSPYAISNVGTPPRVAVIVPAYGVAHLVGEALTSLQRQSFPHWECRVIDDGSPDDVAGAVAPFLNDPRIRLLTTANRGVSAARNLAVRASSAPLVALLDGDDLFRPDYLARTIQVLEADPAARLVTCNARIFGAVSHEMTCVPGAHNATGSLTDVLDRTFNVYIGTTFRRVDFEAVGGFDETMAQSEDFDLWVRLMMRGGHAVYIDAVLGEYRVRAGSASANAGRMLLGNIRVYEKAIATLKPDAPEVPLIQRLLIEARTALAFEHAIDRVIDGDPRRGLQELQACRGQVQGIVWRCSFALWQLMPSLARPMLQWRRRAHRRGGGTTLFPSLAERDT